MSPFTLRNQGQWTQLVEHCYQINISHNNLATVVVGSDTPFGLLNQDYSDEKTAFKLLKEARIISCLAEGTLTNKPIARREVGAQIAWWPYTMVMVLREGPNT